MILLPLIAAHTVGLGAPASTPAPAPTPEQSFASLMSEREAAGFRLSDLDVAGQGDTVELRFELSNEIAAESLRLSYSLKAARFTDFVRVGAELPTEDREYPQAAQLFEELAIGAPLGLSSDCEDYYFDFGSRAVSLDEEGFRVLIDEVDDAAGQALSHWMLELLEEGGELVDVRDEREDDGAEVTRFMVFALAASDGVHELRAELDDGDRVVRVDWHLESGRVGHQRYAHRGALMERLHGAPAIQTIESRSGAGNEPMSLTLAFAGASGEGWELSTKAFEVSDIHSENCRF